MKRKKPEESGGVDLISEGLSDDRRNVEIDIAFKRQDIRLVLTRHLGGWRSVFSHPFPSSSLHYHPALSLDSPIVSECQRSSPMRSAIPARLTAHGAV